MFQTAFPASFAQQRLWFLDKLEPGTAAYNLPRAFRITGPLDLDVLNRAIQAVVRRHESLRTVFDSVDGRPRQIVLDTIDVPISVVDLSSTTEEQRESAALQIASAEGKKPFDLTQGPLLRIVLVQLKPDQQLLILVLHHIITDGWSIAILFRELTKCYEAFTTGRVPDLPELTVQYSEYAQWQREYLSGDVLSEEVQYWKEKLAGAQTVLDLPADRRRPTTHSWSGATEELVFDKSTLIKLKALAQSQGATLFMVSMAAFQAWLWRYTQQKSILVGTPTAARSQFEIENLIGFFVNTLVFRADVTGELTFRELVRQVREFSLEAYAHQDVPFEKLVEELVPQRSVNITPLFQAMFIFQNIPKQIFKIAGLDMEELPFDTGIAKFDLSAEVFEDDDQELHWRFEYNTDLFEQGTIRAFLNHFRNLLNAVIDAPDLLLAEIPLMSAEEKLLAVEKPNHTSADYQADPSIQAAFEQQVDRTPDSVAVRCDSRQLTYQELNKRANRLANYLVKQGVRQGDLVGISLDRSLEMIVALLGVLKAGAAYVPVDPTYPSEWISFVLEDSRVWGVVTQSAARAKLPANITNLVALDTDEKQIGAQSSKNLPRLNHEIAYVLYTSGSTGMPKGVEGTQRGVMNRAAWMWQAYPFQAGEVCCQKTNLGFVDSVWEIFGPLLAGVPSVIISQETLRDPEQLLETLAQEKVTRMVLVPSLLRLLLEHEPRLGERVPELRLWSSSGEVLPVELVERFRAGFPEARLLNLYGSAEVAADATCHEVRQEDCLGMSVSIGKPIGNVQVYILDEKMEPVPIGVRGQIYVGGAGLARGYWGRGELTGERFVGNRWVEEISDDASSAGKASAGKSCAGKASRMYRTGDMGRWRGSGEIEYLGRMDSQVKLRGMRIELGEIEAVLGTHAGVREAVVVLSGEGEQQRLTAYVRLAEHDGVEVTATELRQYLRGKLPEHMVPASYRGVRGWALLPSGKVDRRAVAEQSSEALAEAGGYAAPRTEVEKKLAAMWEELLKVEGVGIDQNFFELGGHSLLALQVMARIRSQLGVELGVRSLFEGGTIAALAAEVEKAERLGQKARPAITPRRARTAATHPEALLAQLDNLSPAELQSLLQQMLDKERAV
jgi:amino acid adenylation domain-containing protein